MWQEIEENEILFANMTLMLEPSEKCNLVTWYCHEFKDENWCFTCSLIAFWKSHVMFQHSHHCFQVNKADFIEVLQAWGLQSAKNEAIERSPCKNGFVRSNKYSTSKSLILYVKLKENAEKWLFCRIIVRDCQNPKISRSQEMIFSNNEQNIVFFKYHGAKISFSAHFSRKWCSRLMIS